MSPQRPACIWVVDDDRSVRFVLATALRQAGWQVEAFEAADGVLQALYQGQVPDLLFTDVRMPGQSGLELLEQLKADQPQQPVHAAQSGHRLRQQYFFALPGHLQPQGGGNAAGAAAAAAGSDHDTLHGRPSLGFSDGMQNKISCRTASLALSYHIVRQNAKGSCRQKQILCRFQ